MLVLRDSDIDELLLSRKIMFGNVVPWGFYEVGITEDETRVFYCDVVDMYLLYDEN